MTAENYAHDAQPGWCGADPGGGTWARLTVSSRGPWLEIDALGLLHWHSQEEAEAAGLVPRVVETAGTSGTAADAQVAPALSNPASSERLRMAAESASVMPQLHYYDVEPWRGVADTFSAQAERQDRQRAEAEQDDDDRKRAEEIAQSVWAERGVGSGIPDAVAPLTVAVLAGIRAGRAEEGAK